jgi:hypothetical protein
MSNKNYELAHIIKYMHKQQHIMAKMLIHLGYRADLYDSFIAGCLGELASLKVPEPKEHE